MTFAFFLVIALDEFSAAVEEVPVCMGIPLKNMKLTAKLTAVYSLRLATQQFLQVCMQVCCHLDCVHVAHACWTMSCGIAPIFFTVLLCFRP